MRRLLAAMLVLLALPVAAQFPSKPVRLVVGFPPGGAADVTIRIIAQGLSAQLGQPVTVENRPGAESVIAAETVRSSPPDGYTLLMGTNTAMVAVPSRANPPYDPFRDFTPISTLGNFTMFLVVSPKLPSRSVAEFLEHVRANPGKLNYASSNSAALLAAVQILAPEKLQMTHVPYKGDVQALNDLMTDRIHMMFGTGTGVPPLAKDGRVRVLATLLNARSPLLPEVPTGKEANVQGISIVPWSAIFGPANMIADLAGRLSREINAVLSRPDTREQFDRQGFEPGGSTPQALATFHKSQWDAWTKTVREQNLKFD